MRKIWAFVIIGAICFFQQQGVKAQCANDNTLLLNFTPVCNGTAENVTNCIVGGQYVAVDVVAGNVYTFSTCGTNAFDSQITIYNSSGGGSLGYNDDGCGTQSSLTWTASFTGVLYVLVDRFSCSTGTVCIPLNITCSVGPPIAAGDEPCTASALTVGTSCTSTSSTTAGATGSTGVAAPTCASYSGFDVWFTAVVPVSGSLTIQTQAGVITDGGMALYSGPNCSSLTQIQCIDDVNGNNMPSAVVSSLTPGSTLYIRVWEYGGNNNGSFGICAFDNSPPPSSACLAPIPDVCTDACDLGTLPTPPACTPGGTLSVGNPLTHNLSNVGATAEVPYSTVTGCASPGSDVWYRFRATGTQLSFSLASSTGDPLNNPNISLYNGNNCNALLPLRCFTGTGGNLAATFAPITPNDYYYLQISGGNVTDVGDFTLVIRNNYDCDNCLLAQDLQITPAPVNGTYGSGQSVQFCFTVSNYNQTAANWIHGIDLNFGPGWDVSTLTPTSIPLPCATTAGANWGFYNSVTGTASGTTYGPGFFYETSSGASSGVVDGNPGNNFGDVGISTTCPRTFCWRISTNPTGSCTPGASLAVAINTLGDYESGSWTSAGCANDPIVNFTATLACCAPPALVITGAGCGTADGKIVATGLGSPPWDYSWSDSTGTVIATHNNINGPDSITNLAAGNYTLTVSDNLGCSVGAAATVSGVSGSSATASNTGPYCPGATISLTTTAGTGYSWSGPGGFTSTLQSPTRASATVAMAGNYTVTVTFAGGCTATATTTVVVNSLPVPAISPPTATICPGGSVTLTASGGATYVWSNAATTAVTTVSPAINTTYTVTVTNASNCTATASRQVTINAVPVATISPVADTICAGSSTTLTASGGNSYVWSTTATTATITVSPAATTTYTVTVTSGTNCSATASAPVTVVPTMAISGFVNNLDCNGDNSGGVNIVVSSGQSPYTYLWGSNANNATTQNISGVAAGTYTVTVTDAAQCTATASATVGEPPVFTVTETHVNVLCNGAATGSISLTPAGGTGPYTYLWGDGNTLQNRTALVAGTYPVTATDNNLCSATLSVTITEPALLTLAETHTNVTCNSTNTGSIDVTTTGGTQPYSYAWSDMVYAEDRTAIPAGTYTLTVYDSYQCSATLSVVISEPTALNVTETHVNAACNGGSTGSINITVTGGLPAYTYVWNDAIATEDRTGLAAGSYAVTVSDANTCTATLSITITEPTALSVTETHTNVSCGGGADGAIDITVAGAVAPYTYVWNDGPTTQDRNAIGLGTYIVTATDINLCSASLSIIVGSASNLNVTEVHTNVSCFGGSDGSITTTTTGGTAPYTYTWNDIVASPNRQALSAGIYLLTVTDANLCQVSVSVSISEPTQLLLAETHADVACNGGATGSIDVTATGATPAYSFVWSDMSYTEDRTAIPAGNYTVSVYDSYQCSATLAVVIAEPAVLSIAETHTDVLCNGDNTGSIDVTVGGGVLPYSYVWNDAILTEDRAAIPAGNYSVVASDNNLCSVSISVVITEPAALVATETHNDVTCYGGADGTIRVTASSGVLPYTYIWNDANNSPDRTGLAAGNYTVTVSDLNYCSVSLSVLLAEPAPIVVSETHTDVSCLGYMDGTATVTAVGGVPPYTYGWSNTSINPGNTGLSAGNYNVTVYDVNQCSATISFTIAQPSGMVMSNTFTNPTCATNSPDGSITLNINGGSVPYQYTWNNALAGAQQTGLLPGDYDVTITDANNCSMSDSFELAYLYDFTIDATPSVDIDFGESTTLGYTLTGTAGNYVSLWSPGESLSCTDCVDPVATPKGTTVYHILVTNDAGCTATDMLTVSVVPDYTIFIPTAFTPNNDGNNDVFQVFGNLKALAYLQMQVFNRWGEKVFESNDHLFQWDGSYKGELQPPGIYTWTLKLTYLNGHLEELRKGTVTMIR